MDTWLSDIAELYSSRALGKSLWVGSSMGAWLTFLLHERHPEWFSAICALAPAFDWDQAIRWDASNENAADTQLVQLADGVRLPAGLLRSMATHHIMNRPYRLSVPAHIIHGARDQYDRENKVSEFALSLGSKCSIEVIDDDHGVAKLSSELSMRHFVNWLKSALRDYRYT